MKIPGRFYNRHPVYSVLCTVDHELQCIYMSSKSLHELVESMIVLCHAAALINLSLPPFLPLSRLCTHVHTGQETGNVHQENSRSSSADRRIP